MAHDNPYRFPLADAGAHFHLPHVRHVLMQQWDPLGVRDEPDASGQYDRFADRAFAMLMLENASAASLGRYLMHVERQLMGQPPPDGRSTQCRRAGRSLVALRRTLTN